MKTALKSTLLLTTVGLSACHTPNDSALPPLITIDYPAAYVVNGESNTLSVIDLASHQVRETILLGRAASGGHSGHTDHSSTDAGIQWPHHIYLSPDGTKLALGVPGMDMSNGHDGGMEGMTGRMVVLDSRTGVFAINQEVPEMNHNTIFSPDGKELWTALMTHPGKVLIYDANTMQLIKTLEVGPEPAEVTFSADKQYAFTANGHGNSVTVIRVSDKSIVKTIPVGEDPVGAWPGADNRMYVDNEKGKSISVIDVATLSVVETIPLDFTPGYAAYNHQLNELWVSTAGSTGNKVVVFHRMNAGWMKDREIITGADAHAIAFTKDGQTAYVTNQGANTVSVIDAKSHIKQKDIPVGKKPNGLVIRP